MRLRLSSHISIEALAGEFVAELSPVSQCYARDLPFLQFVVLRDLIHTCNELARSALIKLSTKYIRARVI